MKQFRVAATLVLAAGLSTTMTTVVPATAATHDTSPRPAANKSKPLLASPARGRAAIRQLGDNLDVAARRNHLTATDLRRILTSDSTAVIYPNGALAYVDTFARGRSSSSTTQPRALVVPVGQTFDLHSRAGSKHTIFLDFDGANVSDTGWNGDGKKLIPNDDYDPFSLDGTVTTAFSTAEYEYIQEVWREVSETYATYDVDVTTHDPGPAGYNRSGGSDDVYGDHVLFTNDPDSYPVCDPRPATGCGGVAFVGSFDNIADNSSYLEPAWVRPTPSAFNTAMAASHEIGHTLGLHHDGTTNPPEPYYSGQGVWTPMMGAGSGAVHQFSNGDYQYANNTKEDDFAVMASHGLPKQPDEAGNTIATASTFGARNSIGSELTGVIGSRSDVDFYKVGPCATNPSISAFGAGTGSALDIRLDVFNASGARLAFSDQSTASDSANPNLGLDAQAISPGTSVDTYYVKVDGVGQGSAKSTGYSDYGSVGTYTLSISNCVLTNGTVPNAPSTVALTNNKTTGTVSWSAPAGGAAPTGYRVFGLPSGPFEVPATTKAKSVTVAGGVDATVQVIAFNGNGSGPAKKLVQHISSWAPNTPPAVSVKTNVLTASLAWTPGANPGGAVLYAWKIQEGNRSNTLKLPDFRYGVNLSYGDYGTHKMTITPLMYADDSSVSPGRTVTFVIAGKPGAPKIGNASSGAPGGGKSATARWAGGGNGGAAITSYKVIAYKLNAEGTIVSYRVSRALRGTTRAYAFGLPAGRYRFRVVAYNVKGASPGSAYSRVVVAR